MRLGSRGMGRQKVTRWRGSEGAGNGEAKTQCGRTRGFFASLRMTDWGDDARILVHSGDGDAGAFGLDGGEGVVAEVGGVFGGEAVGGVVGGEGVGFEEREIPDAGAEVAAGRVGVDGIGAEFGLAFFVFRPAPADVEAAALIGDFVGGRIVEIEIGVGRVGPARGLASEIEGVAHRNETEAGFGGEGAIGVADL